MSAKAQKQIEKTEVDLQRLEKKLRAAEVNKEEVDSKSVYWDREVVCEGRTG